ncbi:MAG: tetratricopeptide repeat protein [Cyanobacteria bacterium P01_C01_bin.120]
MALDPLEEFNLSALPDYDADDEYRALLRALRRQQGFGILFVRCSPERGRQLIDELRQDLSQKHCERLTLTESVSDGDFFGAAEAFLAEHPADVVFVEGLRHSLLEYEDIKRASGWSEAETLNYSWQDVPPILRNLNQQRDEFRNRFPTCFVFLVSPFLVKYLRRRAPDFFDWRSGVFEFKDPREDIARSLEPDLWEDYGRVKQMTPQARREQIIRLLGYLENLEFSADERFKTLFDLGCYQWVDDSYQDAELSWNQALETEVSTAENLTHRGQLLARQQRREEAIASYDRAVAIKPDYYQTWNNRGIALRNLGRYEAAIASYDRAVAIKPDYYQAWNNRGIALRNLDRDEEAIASYDRAVAIKPDKDEAWNNRGIALSELGRYEEAIASYDRAVAIKPDKDEAWNNRGNALSKLGRYEEAIASYDRAVAIKPDDHEAWYNRGNALDDLGRYEEAIASYDRAVAIKPDDHEAWYNRGIVLGKLRRLQEGSASLGKAFELNPQAIIDRYFDGLINRFPLLKGFFLLIKRLASRFLLPKNE